MPLGLWIIGGTSLLHTVWLRFQTPSPAGIALGVFTGGFAGAFGMLLVAKRIFPDK